MTLTVDSYAFFLLKAFISLFFIYIYIYIGDGVGLFYEAGFHGCIYSCVGFFFFLYHNHLDSMVLRSEHVYFDKTV